MISTIPAGYIVSITTYENDGDNYRTDDYFGLTKEEVNFYKWIISFFNRNSSTFGNTEVDLDKIESIKNQFEPSEFPTFAKLLDEYLSEFSNNSTTEEIQWFDNWVSSIVDTWFDYNYYRKVDSVQVLWNPELVQFIEVE
jgi:hypothetical protein